MTITQRMYRALLGAQTTQQSAQAAAHVAQQLLQEQRTITREELNTAMLRAPRGSGAVGVLAQLGIEVTP